MKARMWKAKGYSCDLCHVHCSGIVCFCPGKFAALTGGGKKMLFSQFSSQHPSRSVKAVWCSLIRFGNCILEQCIARLPFSHSLFLNRLLGDLFWTKHKHQTSQWGLWKSRGETKKIFCRGSAELISAQHWYLAQELAMSCGIAPACNP